MRFLLFLLFILALLACSNDVDPISYEEGNSSISSSSDGNSPILDLEIPTSGYYDGSVPPFTIPADVYCEQNGAAPTANSSGQPGTTVNFTKSGVLRCAKFENGEAVTADIMRTYFIGESKSLLPIVSIAAEPETFTTGIYSPPRSLSYMQDFGEEGPCPTPNARPFCKDTTILIHVDFFEPNGEFAWSAPGGLEMMGGWSRAHSKKSVKVSFREKYGQKNIKYPLFPKFGEQKYKDFVLRNFGNSYGVDYYRDRLAAELAEEIGIDNMRGRYVIVYYNGKYKGIHDMRERANKNYFDTRYGIQENNLNLVKNYYDVKVGSDASYWDFINELESSTDATANYNLINENVDIENFTNYFISQIYFDNRDWPGNNIRMWKSNLPGDKWKYFLFDVDFGFGASDPPPMGYLGAMTQCSMIELVTSKDEDGGCVRGDGWPTHYNYFKSTLIMIKLLENPEYREYFRGKVKDLLATNFEPTRVKAKLAALRNEIPSTEANKDCPSCRDTYSIESWVTGRVRKVQGEMEEYYSEKWGEEF